MKNVPVSDRGLELPQEAYVVLEVQPQVLDLPLEHGDALNAHSESESGVLLGVDAAGVEDVGIHHSGAHDLEPACALADVAALAAADVAADVHFGAGLGEGEVGWTHADLGIGTEHLAYEDQDALLEIGKRHVLVHVQTLDLMEDAVGAGRDGFIAEYPAGADDSDRGLVVLHSPHLN